MLAEQVSRATGRRIDRWSSPASPCSRCSAAQPNPYVPGEPLGEQADEQRAGKPDDVQVVALDPLDERRAEPLDRVGAGAPLPLAARQVVARGRAASAAGR